MEKFISKNYNKFFFLFIVFGYLFLFTYKSVQNAKPYFQINTNMADKLRVYNSVIKKDGNILFIFKDEDWNSAYTYYTKHKGLIILISDSISTEMIRQYSRQGYKYVVIDGTVAVATIKTKYPNIIDQFSNIYSSNELMILKI